MLTEAEVVDVAKHAGLEDWTDDGNWRCVTGDLVRFALLVSQAEREACAEECERMMMYPGGRQEAPAHENIWAAAKAIRMRSNVKVTGDPHHEQEQGR